ncbi:hypothetical protein VTH82DRAFT_2385 [Thermothelomyces myriococcoides]
MVFPTRASSLLILLGAASVQAQQRQSLWGQCGGEGWTGPTLCVEGAYCYEQNPWYHQCIPGTGPSTTSSLPSQPSTTQSQPSATLSTSTVTSSPPTSTTSAPGGGTTCPSIPSGLGTPVSNALNDPFTFHGGGKVSTKADWTCRQSEISELLQRYELGTLPPKPSSVTASFSGSTLSITVSENGKTISFSVTINNRPSGSGPHPAIINFGLFGGLPVPSGVATIMFNNDEIAQQQGQSSRGQGKFYDLYGSGHSAGALTAWAWGVSRIIDALELTQAQTNIDPIRIGVTGCSRNGKGAMVAGALEPRIALTLPEESGAGGSGCWRIANYQKSQGQNVQTSTQIVQENVWFSPNFNNYVNNVDALPFDHHLLAGLIAPRAIYIMENSDMEWLGKVSTYGCMGIARKQWEALGALDHFGYSQVGGNSHCSFPSSQQGSELNAFIGKFLLNNPNAGNTNIFRSTGNPNFNIDSWSPWSVPTLS